MMGNMATVAGCLGEIDTSQNAHDEQLFHVNRISTIQCHLILLELD